MFANAANVRGWSLGNPVSKGASVIYDATKNVVINGKEFVKDSWVKITPNATQVAKVLGRGAAGYALSIAVEQLLGAVSWVLDAENNRILYTEFSPLCGPTAKFCYTMAGGKKARTPQEVCRLFNESNGTKYHSASESACYYDVNGKRQFLASIQKVANVDYDASAQEEQKSIPLTTVAQKVISNAESGDPHAQVATTAAAADIVAEAEKDEVKARPIANQAEANAETKPADEAEAEKANEAQGQSKPNEANPEATDISLEFPVFCNWAPTVCEAAQVVISFPQTLTGWYTDTKTKADDWATSISQAYQDFMRDEELPNDDTKLDVSELPTPELQENAISWGAACPADVSIPISMQGVSSTLVFSWSPWCQLLSIIKPAIVASAYIGAAFIVLGLRT